MTYNMCFINILSNVLSICILIFITNNLKKNIALAVGEYSGSQNQFYFFGVSQKQITIETCLYFLYMIIF